MAPRCVPNCREPRALCVRCEALYCPEHNPGGEDPGGGSLCIECALDQADAQAEGEAR